MIRIHNFARGARGQRAMWLCEEMGLEYQVEIVTYPPQPSYLALNPLGSVPFLEDDGAAINESVAIVLYLAQKYGPTPLLPDRDDPALAYVLRTAVFSEASFGAGMNTLMAAHFGAPEAEKRNWSVRMLEEHQSRLLDYLAAMLGENDYLVGNKLTIADLCISTSLGVWIGALGKSVPGRLVAYRERLAARPAYQRALARCRGE